MAKKKMEPQVLTEAQNEANLEKFISNVDQEKVASIKKDLEDFKKSLTNKEYAVSMDASLLKRFDTFMNEEVEWRSKEALGVTEIIKRIEAVKKEGIKDGVAYLTNLEVEASHYFIMKWAGKGSSEIKDFISLWKTFEETLALIQQDNAVVKDLEQQLAAAEQGLDIE
jgi:GTPase involved in cell partitioning and DNA repair